LTRPNCCAFAPIKTELILDAAVEQRRREDAKAEDKAILAISPKSGTFTWQVKAKPRPNLPFPSAFFASSRLCCSHPIVAIGMKSQKPLRVAWRGLRHLFIQYISNLLDEQPQTHLQAREELRLCQ
jgi:hypothetical protein